MPTAYVLWRQQFSLKIDRVNLETTDQAEFAWKSASFGWYLRVDYLQGIPVYSQLWICQDACLELSACYQWDTINQYSNRYRDSDFASVLYFEDSVLNSLWPLSRGSNTLGMTL